MNCDKCGSKRIIEISGKTSDCCIITVPYLTSDEHDGYVPEGIGISEDSDYIEFNYCAECGKIQGKFPISDKAIRQCFFEES